MRVVRYVEVLRPRQLIALIVVLHVERDSGELYFTQVSIHPGSRIGANYFALVHPLERHMLDYGSAIAAKS